MRKLSYNDMQSTSGGYEAKIRNGRVHLRKLTPAQRIKVIEFLSRRGNQAIDPNALVEVGEKPMTCADWAEKMKMDPNISSAPVMPVEFAADMFRGDDKLQTVLNNPRYSREYRYDKFL